MPQQKGRILHFKSPLGEKRCAINALSGQTVASAPSYWPGTLSAREAEIAAVVELAWGFHILALGLVALAIALLSPDPLRARLGVVVTVAFALSQGLSAGTAAQFGYGGTDGMGLFAIVVIGVPLITSRGMKQDAVTAIAGFICDILDDDANITRVAKQVKELCCQYPLYG